MVRRVFRGVTANGVPVGSAFIHWGDYLRTGRRVNMNEQRFCIFFVIDRIDDQEVFIFDVSLPPR